MVRQSQTVRAETLKRNTAGEYYTRERKMHYQTGLCYFNFLSVVLSIPDTFYSVHLEAKSFEEAQIYCKSVDGFLTNMPNHKDTLKILQAIEDKRGNNSTSFWIGLKKNKLVCVEQNLPLKGFCWTVDNTTDFHLNKWKEEPQSTCTGALCGLLSVEYIGTTVVRWGLSSSPCKRIFPFICKHEQLFKEKPCPLPYISGTHEFMQNLSDPYTFQVICNSKKYFTLTCLRSTSEWMLVDGTADLQQLCLDCKNGFQKDRSGTCVDIDKCKQSDICKQNCLNFPISYSCTCFNHDKDLEICKNISTDSFVNSSVDITHEDPDQSVTLENTGDLSKILIPVIIALLIFVVLVVITVALVKYCMMKRSTNRANKRAAAMKETVALNGSDSLEKVNGKHT